jgi:hypothetical protein
MHPTADAPASADGTDGFATQSPTSRTSSTPLYHTSIRLDLNALKEQPSPRGNEQGSGSSPVARQRAPGSLSVLTHKSSRAAQVSKEPLETILTVWHKACMLLAAIC